MTRTPLGKRRRLTQDEARRELIAAGKRLLLDRGLDPGLGLVTLNDAIVESGVPRASAYRAFSNDETDPQVAFRLDLLTDYISDDPLEHRRVAAQEITEKALAALDTDDPVELAHACREAIRIGFAGDVAGLRDDPNWRVIGPSWAAVALADWAPEELVEAHRSSMLAAAAYFVPLYRRLIAACGLRLRTGYSWDDVGLLANSTAVTASFYGTYAPHLRAIPRPTGPGGEMQPWSQAAILVEGLVLVTMEPDPDAEVSADLTVWLTP